MGCRIVNVIVLKSPEVSALAALRSWGWKCPVYPKLIASIPHTLVVNESSSSHTGCAFVKLSRSLDSSGLALAASRHARGAVNALGLVPVQRESNMTGLTEEVVGWVEGLAALNF